MIYDVKVDPILKDPSQKPTMSTEKGHQGQGVLDTLPIMLES